MKTTFSMNPNTRTVRTLALALLLIGGSPSGQAQEFVWAKQFTGAQRIAGRTLSLDGSGNMNGPSVKQLRSNLESVPLPLDGLDAGAYFVRVAHAERTATLRLVVQ